MVVVGVGQAYSSGCPGLHKPSSLDEVESDKHCEAKSDHAKKDVFAFGSGDLCLCGLLRLLAREDDCGRASIAVVALAPCGHGGRACDPRQPRRRRGHGLRSGDWPGRQRFHFRAASAEKASGEGPRQTRVGFVAVRNRGGHPRQGPGRSGHGHRALGRRDFPRSAGGKPL